MSYQTVKRGWEKSKTEGGQHRSSMWRPFPDIQRSLLYLARRPWFTSSLPKSILSQDFTLMLHSWSKIGVRDRSEEYRGTAGTGQRGGSEREFEGWVLRRGEGEIDGGKEGGTVWEGVQEGKKDRKDVKRGWRRSREENRRRGKEGGRQGAVICQTRQTYPPPSNLRYSVCLFSVLI